MWNSAAYWHRFKKINVKDIDKIWKNRNSSRHTAELDSLSCVRCKLRRPYLRMPRQHNFILNKDGMNQCFGRRLGATSKVAFKIEDEFNLKSSPANRMLLAISVGEHKNEMKEEEEGGGGGKKKERVGIPDHLSAVYDA